MAVAAVRQLADQILNSLSNQQFYPAPLYVTCWLLVSCCRELNLTPIGHFSLCVSRLSLVLCWQFSTLCCPCPWQWDHWGKLMLAVCARDIKRGSWQSGLSTIWVCVCVWGGRQRSSTRYRIWCWLVVVQPISELTMCCRARRLRAPMHTSSISFYDILWILNVRAVVV